MIWDQDFPYLKCFFFWTLDFKPLYTALSLPSQQFDPTGSGFPLHTEANDPQQPAPTASADLEK